MPDRAPLVTIGLPTYDRPDFLARALECVARQTCQNFCVVVSDNASPGAAVEEVVERFRDRIPGLVLIKQPINIGAKENFFYLLDQASTKYFMWFADDDEISDNYVENLTCLLESDPGIVTAAGNWYYVQREGQGQLMPSRDYASDRVVLRLAKYMWRADDAFMYGLHRTNVLRKASFRWYVWPNRKEVRNLAYVYLIDMVLSGKVQIHSDKSVRFINHDYTVKSYADGATGIIGLLKLVLRRLNVHGWYLAKIMAARGPLVVLPLIFVSLASLIREGISGLGLRMRGRFGRRRMQPSEDQA